MKTVATQLRRFNRVCLLLVLAGLTLPCAGCSLMALAGIVGDAVAPPRVAPQYVPPKTSSMLVMVENRENPGREWPESEQLAAFISADLTAHQVCEVIPQAKLMDLRDKDTQVMKRMSITDIGKACGAKQVLYVDVMSIDTPTVVGTPVKGRLEMRVHVVDVASGKTAWPIAPNDPMPLSFEAQGPLNLEPDRVVVFGETLLRGAGQHVARLFYEYEPSSPAPK